MARYRQTYETTKITIFPFLIVAKFTLDNIYRLVQIYSSLFTIVHIFFNIFFTLYFFSYTNLYEVS